MSPKGLVVAKNKCEMEEENDIKKLEDQITKIKIELTMKGYHSGWVMKKLERQLEELEEELKQLKSK